MHSSWFIMHTKMIKYQFSCLNVFTKLIIKLKMCNFFIQLARYGKI